MKYKYWIFDRAGKLRETVQCANDDEFDTWNEETDKGPEFPMFFHVFTQNPDTRFIRMETLRNASEAAAHISA